MSKEHSVLLFHQFYLFMYLIVETNDEKPVDIKVPLKDGKPLIVFSKFLILLFILTRSLNLN